MSNSALKALLRSLPLTDFLPVFVCLFLTLTSAFSADPGPELRVEDIFGRTLNTRGLTLVDWEGYIANPLVKFFVFAPTNAALPGSVTLHANGARLYFETPSTVSSSGAVKSLVLSDPGKGVPVRLSIFPDRDGLDEDYTLEITFAGRGGARLTNTVPIHVVDQDRPRTNDFAVTVNFDRDQTGFFTNGTRRDLVQQAAGDWAYFFSGMDLDPVKVGTEQTYIWANNFSGGYEFKNTNEYRGYLLYAYGTTNSLHRSGGEASYSSPVQTSHGSALKLKRSGGFEAEIYGNYNTLGWLLLTDDDQWLASGNLANELNDFYSIAHHEIGHALIFNPAHPGFAAAKTAGSFKSMAVTNYYGGGMLIDPSDHLNGVIDPASGQGAFGYEYFGTIPRKRWLITKADLLAAQETGYQLRETSAFIPVTLATNAPGRAQLNLPYSYQLRAQGGLPFYEFSLTAGALPPGLALDSFTGTISGTPTAVGRYQFTTRIRDYNAETSGVSQAFEIEVQKAPPRLDVFLSGDSILQLQLNGDTGQKQVIESSSDLLDWFPLTTNFGPLPLFTQSVVSGHRFFRALVW